MFTLPPLPPKDYILKDVNQNQKSVQEHTPYGLPRITQASLGKFCAPIEYHENEKLDKADIDFSVNPQILKRWTDNARAFWVDKPGKNAYFLHEIFNNYTVEVESSYDTRYKHGERVFYRSFKYELDCTEQARLEKVQAKVEREENEEQDKMNKIIEEKIAKTDTSMGVKSCKLEGPFWWQETPATIPEGEEVKTVPKPADATTYQQVTCKRWHEEPDLLQSSKSDPCTRRDEMALIGMPFRSEACNWYYDHYPPPRLPWTKRKLA